MTRKLIALSTAVAISAASFAPTAFAMDQELTMLEAAIDGAFVELGIQDVAIGSLTLAQLALVKNVLESEDSTQTKRNRVEAIVNR